MSEGALRHWLEQRVTHWQRLARLVSAPRDARDASPAETLELAQRLRTLSRDLSMARRLLPRSRLRQDLEALHLRAHELVTRPPRNVLQDLRALLLWEVPAIVREMRGTIAAVTALFIGSGLVGWLLVGTHPELAALFASDTMIEQVQRGELWTDGLLNVVPSSVLSIGIMANNISVSLFAFALGALYGLGPLYIVVLNGLMLGGIFAFTHQYAMAERLFSFVIAHGVVELSVICLAAAAGIRVGRALVEPGPRSRALAFQREVAKAAKLLPVTALFLVGAGLIEGYVSPDPSVGLPARVTVGLAYGALLWVVLSGRLARNRHRFAG